MKWFPTALNILIPRRRFERIENTEPDVQRPGEGPQESQHGPDRKRS